MVLKQFLTAWY